METQHDILVQNKRKIQFKFTIYRKFTVIRGDSASGKTTLFQMVSDAMSSRMSGVTVSCDVPVKALYEGGYRYELANESGNIYIVDEDFGPLKTKEFAAAVLKSDNCFILITRESLPGIPYSYREIYKIRTSGKFHSLERVYSEHREMDLRERIVTEDEDAGLEYYRHFYGEAVLTSHGNSNLSKYGNEKTLLIGDGCAIGAFIQDLELTKAALYLPESFEWKLLGNGMFWKKTEVQRLMEEPGKAVQTEYGSIEKYCSELLSDLTRNTPAQYTKSKLNPCFTEKCCCKNTRCEFFTKEKQRG